MSCLLANIFPSSDLIERPCPSFAAETVVDKSFGLCIKSLSSCTSMSFQSQESIHANMSAAAIYLELKYRGTRQPYKAKKRLRSIRLLQWNVTIGFSGHKTATLASNKQQPIRTESQFKAVSKHHASPTLPLLSTIPQTYPGGTKMVYRAKAS